MKRTQISLVLLWFWLAVGTVALAYVRPRPALPPIADLAGQLLVANRQLADPNFSRSVIYVVSHSEQGAMGLIVNRVLGTGTLKAVLSAFGIESRDQRPVALHLGGPVEVGRGFVLHSDDYTGVSTQLLGKALALSTGPDVMRALADGRGPKQALLLVGYAGWGARQLDHELARGDWLTAPPDAALIFSSEPERVWERALQRAGISL